MCTVNVDTKQQACPFKKNCKNKELYDSSHFGFSCIYLISKYGSHHSCSAQNTVKLVQPWQTEFPSSSIPPSFPPVSPFQSWFQENGAVRRVRLPLRLAEPEPGKSHRLPTSFILKSIILLFFYLILGEDPRPRRAGEDDGGKDEERGKQGWKFKSK